LNSSQLELALVVERLPQVLHGGPVLRAGRAHEALRRQAEREPLRAELLGHAVDERLRRELLLRRGLGDLLAVLVGPGDEEGILAGEPVVARERVGDRRGVGRAEVRRRVGIVDRRRQVEGAHRASDLSRAH